MATARYQAMSFQPTNNQCVDPAEMENLFDFGGLTSPMPNNSSSRMPVSQAPSAMTSPTSAVVPLDGSDDHQTPVAPSHDYTRFKQQTGLPAGSIASLRELNEGPSMFEGFNTGLDEFGLSTSMYDQTGLGSMTGDLGFDSDMTATSSLPAFFYPGDNSQNDDFIDPTTIQKQEEARANIRYYPGMHQEAALRAQQQAQQQRQQQMLAQQQKQREAEQQRGQSSRRSASHHPVDPHTEETIARVVNQIRQNSNMSVGGDSMSPNPSSVLPHIIKAKREEDDMDEDERLLNSEEGKKLSSKERRQLRNKVSARAFRSRRKEYIGQLEGEVAMKINEANELKVQNRALMEENARFRSLAEKLLGHAAFRPFLDELSRDPELAQSLSQMSQPSATPTQQPAKKDTNPYSGNSQQFMSPQHSQNQRVGMALMPEPQIDFSSLNIGGNNWAMPSIGMNNFQQPQVFAVLEVPEPAKPIDVATLSGKYEDSIVEELTTENSKSDCPAEIEIPSLPKDEPVVDSKPVKESEPTTCQFDESDPAFTLFASASSTPSTPAAVTLSVEELVAEIPCEKTLSQFELVVSGSQNMTLLFEKKCAKMDAACQRLDTLFSSFGL